MNQKSHFNSLFSILLALCLMQTFVFSDIPVLAEATQASVNTSFAKEVNHLRNNSVSISDAASVDAALNYDADVSINGDTLTISLNHNITLSESLVLSGMDTTRISHVILNLNGHTLQGAPDTDTLMIRGNFNLTVNGGNEISALSGAVIGGPGSEGQNGQGAITYLENKLSSESKEYPVITLQNGALIAGGSGGAFSGKETIYHNINDPYGNPEYTDAIYTIPSGGYGIGSESYDNPPYFKLWVKDAAVRGGDASDTDISDNTALNKVNANNSFDLCNGGDGGMGVFLPSNYYSVIIEEAGTIAGGDGADLTRSRSVICSDSSFPIDNWEITNAAGDGGAGIYTLGYFSEEIDAIAQYHEVTDPENPLYKTPEHYGCQIHGTVKGGNGGSAKGRKNCGGSGGDGIYLDNSQFYCDNNFDCIHFPNIFEDPNSSSFCFGGSINITPTGKVLGGNGGDSEWSNEEASAGNYGGNAFYNFWVYNTIRLDGIVRGGDGGNGTTGLGSPGEGGDTFYGANQHTEFYGTIEGNGTCIHGNGGTGYASYKLDYPDFYNSTAYSGISGLAKFADEIKGGTYYSYDARPTANDGTWGRLVYSGAGKTDLKGAKAGETITCQVYHADGTPYTGDCYYKFYVFGSRSVDSRLIEASGNTYTITEELLEFLNSYVNSYNGYSAISFYALVTLENGVTFLADPVGMMLSDAAHLPGSSECAFTEQWDNQLVSCGKKGISFQRCAYCGLTRLNITGAKPHHLVRNEDASQDADCTSHGVIIYDCTECDEYFYIHTDAVGHTLNDSDIKKQPSCTTKGRFEGTCLVCGETYPKPPFTIPGELPALGHTPLAGTLSETKATCTTDGIKTYTCARCKETITEITKKKGHVMLHTPGIRINCSGAGKRDYWQCSECGQYFLDNKGWTQTDLTNLTLPVLSHNAVHVAAAEATSQAAGNTEYWYCSECAKYYSDRNLTVEITQAATVIPIISPGNNTGNNSNPDNNSSIFNNSFNSFNNTVSSFNDNGNNEKGSFITIGTMTYCITNPGKEANGKITGAELEFVKAAKYSATMYISTSITVNDITYKVTGIAGDAFKNNKTIKTIYAGDNIKTIGAGAFSGCKNLKSISWGANLKTINNNAFRNCVKLSSVTFDKKISKIGAGAFSGCRKLKTITFKNTKAPAFGKNTWKGINKKAAFKIPRKAYNAYKKKLTMKTGYIKTMKLKNY